MPYAASPVRCEEILTALSHGPMTVSELTRHCARPRDRISRSLYRLEDEGKVSRHQLQTTARHGHPASLWCIVGTHIATADFDDDSDEAMRARMSRDCQAHLGDLQRGEKFLTALKFREGIPVRMIGSPFGSSCGSSAAMCAEIGEGA